MYYLGNDTPAMARTSNLNEELGQVRPSLETLLVVTEVSGETSAGTMRDFGKMVLHECGYDV